MKKTPIPEVHTTVRSPLWFVLLRTSLWFVCRCGVHHGLNIDCVNFLGVSFCTFSSLPLPRSDACAFTFSHSFYMSM